MRKAGKNIKVRDRAPVRENALVHSTVTSKGQTTIPAKIRKALRIKPSDRLQYELAEDYAIMRVHHGAAALKGVLASKKGKVMAFARIPEVASGAARSLR